MNIYRILMILLIYLSHINGVLAQYTEELTLEKFLGNFPNLNLPYEVNYPQLEQNNRQKIEEKFAKRYLKVSQQNINGMSLPMAVCGYIGKFLVSKNTWALLFKSTPLPVTTFGQDQIILLTFDTVSKQIIDQEMLAYRASNSVGTLILSAVIQSKSQIDIYNYQRVNHSKKYKTRTLYILENGSMHYKTH